MTSPIALIAAPSLLGLSRPDGRVPRVDLLPEALMEAGLGRRLGVTMETTVTPGPYVPERDPVVGVHNAPGIVDLAHRLADVVEAARRASRVPVVLGGDCSILLGCLLGLKRTGARHGLAFLDGHTDFWPPSASPLGGVAGMDLWFSTGRGPAVLSNLEGRGPLVSDADVALLGVRDSDDWGGAAGAEHAWDTAMLYLDLATLRRDGIAASMDRALSRLRAPGLEGFWIHLDADVMDDAVMPAVDSRQPDGLRPEELSEVLALLAGSGRVAGVDVTIYDPSLDPGRTAARVLTDVLVQGLGALASPPRTRQAGADGFSP
ncbi:arginase family protein [Pyxidicoccus parkwayensis]|uniref:Arginase family protein n=1 Tax=Pyxidicoccus parkwayensis TaxID=2813578 RepID=A0ABX7NKE5_9BACT|nr:arginase family protein [Pyxidicoccus parkwaysis]QSQ18921.1 arginase family protein [Pyxidicoccus parkwaysis]